MYGKPTKSRASTSTTATGSQKAPQLRRIGSRQAFLATAYEALRVELGRPLSQHLRQEVMTRHAAMFGQLDAQQRQFYEHKARAMQARKAQALEDESSFNNAVSDIQTLRNDGLHALSSMPSLLSGAVLDDDEVTKLQSHADELIEVPLRDRLYAVKATPPPSSEMKHELSLYPAEEFCPEFPLTSPLWASLVCRHREMFRNTILAMPHAVEETMSYYIVLFAMQKPHVLVLAPLTMQPLQTSSGSASSMSVLDRSAHLQFVWDGLTVVEAATLLPHDVCDVHVFLAAVALGNWRFECDKVSFTLLAFVGEDARAKIAKKADKKESQAKTSKPPADDISKYPWLAKYAVTQASSRSNRKTPSRPSHVHSDDEPLSPDAVNQAFATLQEKRAEWSCEQELETEHFKTVVRGGAWTQAHRKVAVDSISGQACTTAAKKFCLQYGLPRLASYSFAKFGERVAKLLAQSWVHKMSFWHTLFLEAEDAEFLFSDVQLDSYVEMAELSAMRVEMAGLHQGVEERLSQLDRLRPTNSSRAHDA